MREYGTIPVDPSDDAGDEGGISDWVSLNKQATDPNSHTLVSTPYTAIRFVLPPANSDGRPLLTNVGKTRRALEAVEFLVVQENFLTDTAAMADVVLPAASFAETDGTFTNSERRVQRVRKAVEPPGMAKPDWVILSELSTRLGYPMAYRHPSEIWDELARNTPILSGISYDRIELQGIQWPCPTTDHPGTPYLHKDSFVSGKGVFQSIPHVPVAEPPDEDYPLTLTTGRRRSTYHTGSQTGRAAGFELLVAQEWAEVSPEDAARFHLTDREEVDVVSRRGRLRVPVKITDRSPPGVVFMSFHFPGRTLTNLLTTDACDPITETPEFKACAVRIERVAEKTTSL